MVETFKWMHGAAVAAFVAGLSAASAQQTIAPASTTPTGGPLPDVLLNYAFVNSERLKKPEDGNWLLFRRTYDGWGYSPLSQSWCGASPPARSRATRRRPSSTTA
jgi:alcohol dehydrogenase (cytochrome c)